MNKVLTYDVERMNFMDDDCEIDGKRYLDVESGNRDFVFENDFGSFECHADKLVLNVEGNTSVLTTDGTGLYVNDKLVYLHDGAEPKLIFWLNLLAIEGGFVFEVTGDSGDISILIFWDEKGVYNRTVVCPYENTDDRIGDYCDEMG